MKIEDLVISLEDNVMRITAKAIIGKEEKEDKYQKKVKETLTECYSHFKHKMSGK